MTQILKRVLSLAGALGVLLAAATATAAAERAPRTGLNTVRDTFEDAGSTREWQPIHGDWAIADGGFCQREPGGAEYRYALTTVPFAPCLVTVRTTPISKNSYDFLSFGIVVRYQDEANWLAVRFGSYGGVSTIALVDGQKAITSLGHFVPEPGRTYAVAAGFREDRIAVFLDERLMGLVRAPGPSTSGRAGLFTESACRFDDFVAHGDRDAWLTYTREILGAADQRLAARAVSRDATLVLKGGVFTDGFDAGDTGLWRNLKGTWTWREGRLNIAADGWGRFVVLAPVLLQDGAISGSAVPTANSVHGHGVFGVMVKWLDSANWMAVRYGQYGSVAAYIREDGKQSVKGLGTFPVRLGQTYDFGVTVAGNRLTASCDGQTLGALDAPFAGRQGQPGLYTEAPGTYDDFQVTGAEPIPPKVQEPLAAKPDLDLAFQSFRCVRPPRDDGRIEPHGLAFFYVRNRGPGPAELNRLCVGGVDAEHLRSSVPWTRQRPHSLAPGEMGEVTVCFESFPLRTALAMFEDPVSSQTLPIRMEFRGDVTLEAQLPVARAGEPLRINSVSFSATLQRMYVYVQRNGADGDVTGEPWVLNSVSLNGRDVTGLSQFGRRELSSGVVPVVVNLPAPLRRGEPVVVVVATEEGRRAGHSVRAFPGTFHIQVTLLGQQTRPDAVRDIYRHNATCIGLCGADEARLKEARELGLDAFHYGRGGLAALRRFDRPDYPDIAGFWLDEMDKLPVGDTFDRIRDAEAAYRENETFIPLQMVNLCAGRDSRAPLLYEIGDAVCSAYGFHGGALGQGFGRVASLARREYRLTRRAFTPYFRDAEMPVVIDPASKTVRGREPKYRRCIEPKEERWLTYGCLIQGAKGILHWNYGSGIRQPPSWFSKTNTTIRASLGGVLDHDPHGYRIPADMAAELRRVWEEIGRINIELRALGPLLAVSDVSRLAHVVESDPELSPSGEPAAEAAALVSGLDSIVLIVLNHNIKTNWRGDADRGIESYEPIDVTVALHLPPWLEPTCTFTVRHTGVEEIQPVREDTRLQFTFRDLEVSAAVVITARSELMAALSSAVRKCRDRSAGTDK